MNICNSDLFDKYSWSFFDRHEGLSAVGMGLEDKNIFITGATGLFGTWFLSFIDWCHSKQISEPRVTALVRRDLLKKRNYLTSVIGNIHDFPFPKTKFDRLINLAAPSARDTYNGMTDLQKLDQLYHGTRNILNFASQNVDGRGIFTSSGAIYGGFSALQQEPITELNRSAPLFSSDQIGLGLGKRIGEFLVADYVRNGAVDACIARCFSFVGPGLPTNLHYAIGNFISDAVLQKDLIINGDGTPVRSFMHLGDALYWILAILESGKAGDDYNVGSEEAISISNLALMVRDCVNPSIEIDIKGNNNTSPGNPINHYYVPDVSKAKNTLGLKQSITLYKAIKEFGDFLRECDLKS